MIAEAGADEPSPEINAIIAEYLGAADAGAAPEREALLAQLREDADRTT
jgi:hypothetical protein